VIYIVIGQSGSGKTTFVKERFITGDTVIINDIVPCTVCKDIILIGKYNVGLRTEGTDCLPYNYLGKIEQQIEKLGKRTIVVEGDRINNSKFFEFLINKGIEGKLYLLVCPVEVSIKRLRGAGSKITEKFVRTTRTKSINNFIKYRYFFDGEEICTG